jgi:hypothetical protein
MKKVAVVLVVVFLAVAIPVGIGVRSVQNICREGEALDKESKQFAEATVLAVTSTWEPKELEKRASAEFKSVTTPVKIKEIFGLYAKLLGKLKTHQAPNGEANISVINGRKQISAKYYAQAEFDSGPANIEITMVKRDNAWWITGFNINSDAFIKSHKFGNRHLTSLSCLPMLWELGNPCKSKIFGIKPPQLLC